MHVMQYSHVPHFSYADWLGLEPITSCHNLVLSTRRMMTSRSRRIIIVVSSIIFNTVLFPNIPPKHLRELTRTIPTARKPHPVLQFFDSVPEDQAFDHLTSFLQCRRYILPAMHDVMLRLLYRGLAVRYKFWFLQGSVPDVVCCETPSCHGVETEEHLLFGCRRVRPMWSALLPLWERVIGQLPWWRDVVLGKSKMVVV